jgi:hypothetical protein
MCGNQKIVYKIVLTLNDFGFDIECTAAQPAQLSDAHAS